MKTYKIEFEAIAPMWDGITLEVEDNATQDEVEDLAYTRIGQAFPEASDIVLTHIKESF